MFRHLTDILVAWGPAGILLLSILDSSGVPVAGVFDALLILIAVKNPNVGWLCAGLAVVGSTIGSVLLFSAARKGGGRFATGEPTGRSARFRAWFRRYGMVTVFVPALLPIPMPLKLFVVSAGVLGTSMSEFVAVVLLARFLRYFGEAWLGMRLGLESTTFLKSHGWHFLTGAVILSLLLVGFIQWKDRNRRPA